MAECLIREHFIPLRISELIETLCAEQDLPRDDQASFQQFCRLITAIFHFEFNRFLADLKTAYAPFDPDADTTTLGRLKAEQRQQKLNDLFQEFSWLMDRAGFRHLSRDEIAPALERASYWGLNMDVDFRVFERLAIFARGDTSEKRNRRRFWSRGPGKEINVPIYRRLVMILKLRPHPRLGKKVDTEKVFLQLFKDIPKLDLKMLLPGARIRISQWDRSKIGLSLLSGLGLTVWKIFQDIAHAAGEVIQFVLFQHPATLWGLATGTFGYGIKSYYDYQKTRQRYNLSLREVLYFQNLDTNAGVLFRVLDEAEEQQCREAIIGYYFLWLYGGNEGWTRKDWDEYIERNLKRWGNLQVDFEIGDVIAMLQRLQLVEQQGDRFRAVPLARAVHLLCRTWEKYFECTDPAGVEPPVPAGSGE